jgi:hypothetical protein
MKMGIIYEIDFEYVIKIQFTIFFLIKNIILNLGSYGIC